MKALVLAAGRGTRLGALTADRPKPMLPIVGVPMLERILRGIHESARIVDFVLVIGYLGDVVRAHFGDGSRFGWRVEYVEQVNPQGLGQAVHLAAPLLSDGPFLMTYGDMMLGTANYEAAVALYDDGAGDVVLGLNWVDDPWSGAAVYVEEEPTPARSSPPLPKREGEEILRVLRIEEKPAKGTSTTHWNNAGLFVLPPMVFEYTAKLPLSTRGEYEFADAISAMLADGLRIQGLPLTGSWRDVGTPADYEAINKEYGVELGS